MAAFDNTYSRMVAWLKIILPLSALAILSTLFLVSRSIDPTLSLPFAEGTLQDLAREPKIGNPSFSGVAPNGAAISLNAKVALPLVGSQTGLKVRGLTGIFETPGGLSVDLSAPAGIFDSTAQTATLTQGVSLKTSSGYSVQTDNILANLNTSTLSTAGAITADGPFGQIAAGQMVLRQQKTQAGENSYELVFTQGVKLIYVPQQQ